MVVASNVATLQGQQSHTELSAFARLSARNHPSPREWDHSAYSFPVDPGPRFSILRIIAASPDSGRAQTKIWRRVRDPLRQLENFYDADPVGTILIFHYRGVAGGRDGQEDRRLEIVGRR